MKLTLEQMTEAYIARQKECVELRETVIKLKILLRDFENWSRHTKDCPEFIKKYDNNGFCTCGLDKLLERVEK